MRPRMRRRQLLAAVAVAAALPAIPARSAAAARVVVVGGGFAGAVCARALKRAGPRVEVTLVEPVAAYTACPLSSAVIAGLRDLARQRFGYDVLKAEGIAIVAGLADAVDAAARRVVLADGTKLPYDRLVLAPGIELRWDALPGYDEAAAASMPHAWQAGEQTLLLRRQLEAMEDGGLVAIAVPEGPMRCAPAPYERASLIAHYLQRSKPRSKVLLLDANDTMPRQAQFAQAWARLYPGRIERVPLSQGGAVVAVQAATRTLVTDFDRFRPAVANVIPPQRAGRMAGRAEVADRSGWCPVDLASFESRLRPGIHVIGDAVLGGALPKSASGAAAQALRCAMAIGAMLADRPVEGAELRTACHSLVAPDYGIEIAGRFAPRDGMFAEVDAANDAAQQPSARVPGADDAADAHARQAEAAFEGFAALTREAFG